MTEYQEGYNDAYNSFKALVCMPEEERYKIFNNGHKITIKHILSEFHYDEIQERLRANKVNIT